MEADLLGVLVQRTQDDGLERVGRSLGNVFETFTRSLASASLGDVAMRLTAYPLPARRRQSIPFQHQRTPLSICRRNGERNVPYVGIEQLIQMAEVLAVNVVVGRQHQVAVRLDWRRTVGKLADALAHRFEKGQAHALLRGRGSRRGWGNRY